MSHSEPNSLKPPRVYDAVFYCAYFANVFMLISISLLFRYADFIKSIGGDEFHLGWVVGIGTVGAVVFRLVQGQAIDNFGPILIWIVFLVGLIVSNLLHVGIEDVGQWQLYAIRLLMNLCIAGVFGAWLSFVSIRVPDNRVAEVIGVVGSSGFVGMATGPVIGDWIFGSGDSLSANVDRMFHMSAGLLICSLVCVIVAAFIVKKEPNIQRIKTLRENRQSVWQLLKTCHPGFVLIVAAVMGFSISLPGNFLLPFAKEQGIEEIKVFFVIYNVVAFVSRVTMRRMPERIGLRNAILCGLGCMAVSMVLYSTVNSKASLILPAIAGGLAHSFLFPSVIAGGTAFFPKENRGLATSLTLAMYDIGVLIGSPLFGMSVTRLRSVGAAEYQWSFCLWAIGLLIAATIVWRLYEPGDGNEMTRRNRTS